MTPNPVTKFREDRGLSLSEMAELSNVTEQVIRNAEHGLFNHLPPSIERGMVKVAGKSARLARIEYDEWLLNTLEKSKLELPPVGSVRTFVRWRYAISDSVLGFCKLLKVQPTIVQNYEYGKTRNLPSIIVDRVRALGYNEEYVDWLKNLPAN